MNQWGNKVFAEVCIVRMSQQGFKYCGHHADDDDKGFTMSFDRNGETKTIRASFLEIDANARNENAMVQLCRQRIRDALSG